MRYSETKVNDRTAVLINAPWGRKKGPMFSNFRLLLACSLIAVVAGCMTPTPEMAYTFIEVRATADQKLMLNGQKVDPATFVKKATFNKASDDVMLHVHPDSLVTEETVKDLIDHLRDAGYDVSMKAGSKYASLNSYATRDG